jgi:hypothetical protein
VVSTVNDPGAPMTNVALFALEMASAWTTVSVTLPVDGA